MKPTTVRRIAGWAVLSLIPIIFVTLAILAGQLVEAAIGLGIAVVICLAAYTGIALLDTGRRQ